MILKKDIYMEFQLLKSLPSESIKDYAYRVIKTNIINLNLEPGEDITENKIAAILNVSRTPVRETFAKLVSEGLIEIYPQRGTLVSLIDLKRVKESEFMRLTLELAVIEIACRSFPEYEMFQMEANLNQQEFYYAKKNFELTLELDNEFHGLIFKGCGKEHIWDAIHFISGDYNRIRKLKLIHFLSSYDIIKQHKSLRDAIKNKDVKMAKEIIQDHIGRVDTDKEVLRQKYPMYFK